MAATKKTTQNRKTTTKSTAAQQRAAKAKERAAVARERVARLEQSGLGKQATGFMKFVREQGVVGLAVGLAIGTQAGATVKAIVEGFINPIVAFIVGNNEGLLSATWNVVGKDTDKVNYWFTLGDRQLVFGWGLILSSLITLLAVAAVIYYVVKGLKLDKLDRKKDA